MSGRYVDLPRHDFFQSDETFSLSIYVKNLKPEDVSVAFRERSIKLILGKDTYDLNPLSHGIDPERSSFRVVSVKVELTLAKLDKGVRWLDLVGDEAVTHMSASKPNERSSSVNPANKPKKDWSRVVDEEMESLKKADGATEESDVNELFRSIYANADEDSRKAMIKSMQESGGTTLSTNWKDIGSKKTMVTPPEGMIAKKWEQ
ncbi:Suppressor of G2 allele of skp1 [Phaffia rhodozyma]|uniref:Suppressor of G2 allele of skp1 n=1 Tax=Phaffia rhodozyma TaxID=264483 RepID=A0A0F7SSI3_PHARH|nr:Suppressor of G2 allele of skp1 [Phaffia rhodozyma]